MRGFVETLNTGEMLTSRTVKLGLPHRQSRAYARRRVWERSDDIGFGPQAGITQWD